MEDKALLVCFFDIEQRPSRNSLLELSKRVDDLARQGISVIAVHASKIEKNTLDAWLKENNITIPVGIVEGDSEQIRFNWAVQSLPWLILTDTEHIVTDEGLVKGLYVPMISKKGPSLRARESATITR